MNVVKQQWLGRLYQVGHVPLGYDGPVSLAVNGEHWIFDSTVNNVQNMSEILKICVRFFSLFSGGDSLVDQLGKRDFDRLRSDAANPPLPDDAMFFFDNIHLLREAKAKIAENIEKAVGDSNVPATHSASTNISRTAAKGWTMRGWHGPSEIRKNLNDRILAGAFAANQKAAACTLWGDRTHGVLSRCRPAAIRCLRLYAADVMASIPTRQTTP